MLPQSGLSISDPGWGANQSLPVLDSLRSVLTLFNGWQKKKKKTTSKSSLLWHGKVTHKIQSSTSLTNFPWHRGALALLPAASGCSDPQWQSRTAARGVLTKPETLTVWPRAQSVGQCSGTRRLHVDETPILSELIQAIPIRESWLASSLKRTICSYSLNGNARGPE